MSYAQAMAREAERLAAAQTRLLKTVMQEVTRGAKLPGLADEEAAERRLLEGDTAGGWRGRTQYVNILKAIVEDDVQVTWVTPHIPSRHSHI